MKKMTKELINALKKAEKEARKKVSKTGLQIYIEMEKDPLFNAIMKARSSRFFFDKPCRHWTDQVHPSGRNCKHHQLNDEVGTCICCLKCLKCCRCGDK
jgi:hypothetical protein